MAGLRTALVLLAAVVLVASAAASGADSGAARLRALLNDAHVPLPRSERPTAASFPAAWAAFQRFSRTEDWPNDRFEFEFGVFESHYWGTSFEVVLADRQVHLVVHFPVAAYIALTHDLRTTPCVRGARCAFRCLFKGDDAVAPHPCRVTPSGYRVADMALSAPRSTPWVAAVEASPVFRALLARHVRPVGYELWAG